MQKICPCGKIFVTMDIREKYHSKACGNRMRVKKNYEKRKEEEKAKGIHRVSYGSLTKEKEWVDPI